MPPGIFPCPPVLTQFFLLLVMVMMIIVLMIIITARVVEDSGRQRMLSALFSGGLLAWRPGTQVVWN